MSLKICKASAPKPRLMSGFVVPPSTSISKWIFPFSNFGTRYIVEAQPWIMNFSALSEASMPLCSRAKSKRNFHLSSGSVNDANFALIFSWRSTILSDIIILMQKRTHFPNYRRTRPQHCKENPEQSLLFARELRQAFCRLIKLLVLDFCKSGFRLCNLQMGLS